jgi:hypothetical protein
MTANNSLEKIYHNNHNVFILGAGFSVDAGLPTMKDFMAAMRRTLSWASDNNQKQTREDISHVLSLRLSSASAAHRCKINPNNIEDLFSLYDGLSGEGVNTYNRLKMQRAISATLEHCMTENRTSGQALSIYIPPHAKTSLDDKYLSGLLKNRANDKAYVMPLYDAYAVIFSNMYSVGNSSKNDIKNSIISFNYDTLLEESLERIGAKFNIGIASNLDKQISSDYSHISFDEGFPGLQLLKLHGSTNWAISKSDRCETCYDIHVFKTASELFAAQKPLDQLILEPPTWNKGRSAAILQGLWQKAISAIRTATRIYIIGYSLPQSDMHFKYLMAAGLADNISLEEIVYVNPALGNETDNQSLRARLFDTFREEHELEGTIKLLPGKAQDFILAPGGSRHINANLFPFKMYPELDHSLFQQL